MPARKCPYCRVVSNTTGKFKERQAGGERDLLIEQCQNCNKFSYYEVHPNDILEVYEVFPRVDIDVDETLPDDVKKALTEAYQAFEAQIWNACVTMSRRAIEEATKEMQAAGKDLNDKIENLAASDRITSALKDWAHEGRLGGNLGAHGSKQKNWADDEDAGEILEFTKWFMRYAYVLPAQLAERRRKVSGPQPASQSTKDSNVP